MIRRRALGQQQHALLPQGDQQAACFPSVHQPAAGFEQGAIGEDRVDGVRRRHPGGQEGLDAIGLDGRGAAPAQGGVRMRVHGEDLALRARGAANAVRQRLGKEALAVVRHDDGVDIADGAIEQPHGFLGLGRWQGPFAFPVDAHHLLMTRDDPGFDRGGNGGVALDG